VIPNLTRNVLILVPLALVCLFIEVVYEFGTSLRRPKVSSVYKKYDEFHVKE
jgi:hypothetical protein